MPQRSARGAAIVKFCEISLVADALTEVNNSNQAAKYSWLKHAYLEWQNLSHVLLLAVFTIAPIIGIKGALEWN
jgi:hypothetical protein